MPFGSRFGNLTAMAILLLLLLDVLTSMQVGRQDAAIKFRGGHLLPFAAKAFPLRPCFKSASLHNSPNMQCPVSLRKTKTRNRCDYRRAAGNKLRSWKFEELIGFSEPDYICGRQKLWTRFFSTRERASHHFPWHQQPPLIIRLSTDLHLIFPVLFITSNHLDGLLSRCLTDCWCYQAELHGRPRCSAQNDLDDETTSAREGYPLLTDSGHIPAWLGGGKCRGRQRQTKWEMYPLEVLCSMCFIFPGDLFRALHVWREYKCGPLSEAQRLTTKDGHHPGSSR